MVSKFFGSAIGLYDLSDDPASPDAGSRLLYAKSGGVFYKKSDGVEVLLGPDPHALPVWAGTDRQNFYLPELNVYNAKGSNLRKTRAGLARMVGDGAPLNVLVIGDSLALGYGTSTIVDADTFPRAMSKDLAWMLNSQEAGSGVVPVVVASGVLNSLWTTTGTVAKGSSPGFLTMSASSTTTFAPPQECTGFEFYYSDISANFTYQIDGGTAVGVTCTATAVQMKKTITGLSPGVHTLKINAPGTVYITGARTTGASTGIALHNMSYGGSRAYGADSVAWDGTSAVTALNRTRRDQLDLSGLTFDLVIVALQGNDAFQSVSVANSMGAMENIREWYPDADFLMVQAWEVPTTNAGLWDDYYEAKYALADSLDCIFVDWRDRHGDVATAVADGLTAVDNIHPNPGVTREWGRNIADIIAGGVQTPLDIVGMLPADSAAGTASLRTLGIGATQSAAGDHGHTASAISDFNTAADARITAAKDTDVTLAANSDAKIPSQKAVKAYVDALLDANNAYQYKGVIDCSANPNYPAASAGHTYKVSVAGKIGGASGVVVEVGDSATCLVDSTASGNQATVGANWIVLQTNIDGAVTGPSSSVALQFPRFVGTTGKVIEDSGVSLDTDTALTANSDTKIASQKAAKAYTDGLNYYAKFKTIATKTADYQLASGDIAAYIRCNKSGAMSLTVPAGLGIGWTCDVFNISTSDVTISAVIASGVTFKNAVGLKLGQNKGCTLVVNASDVVDVIGGLSA